MFQDKIEARSNVPDEHGSKPTETNVVAQLSEVYIFRLYGEESKFVEVFLPRAVMVWNSLPTNVQAAESL